MSGAVRALLRCGVLAAAGIGAAGIGATGIGAAQAASFDSLAEVERRLKQDPAPDAVAVCAPALPVVEALSTMIGRLPLPARDAGSLAAFSPDVLRAHGVDLDGALVVSAWSADDALRLELPFSGSRERAAELLGLLGGEPATEAGKSWETHLGRQSMRARLDPGVLVLESPTAHRTSTRLPRDLLTGLPHGSGCAFALLDERPGAKVHNLAVAGSFLPDQPGRVRLFVNEPAPRVLSGSTWRPSGMHTPGTPSALLTLGVPAGTARAVGRRFPRVAEAAPLFDALIGRHGLTLAMFPGLPPSMMMVSPRRGPFGIPHSEARILRDVVKAAERAGVSLTVGPRGDASLTLGRFRLVVGASRGRLLVAMNEQDLAVLRADTGAAWEDDPRQERARAWPLTAQVTMPQGALGLSARAASGYWEMELEGGLAAGSALGGTLAGLATPAFVGMQAKAKRAECASNLQSLRTHELAWHAEHDVFLAAPAHPRPAAEADHQELGWGDPPAWATLGWRPDGAVRGVYEVRLTPSGFVASCTIDSDGDGRPARFEATEQHPPKLLTAPEVY